MLNVITTHLSLSTLSALLDVSRMLFRRKSTSSPSRRELSPDLTKYTVCVDRLSFQAETQNLIRIPGERTMRFKFR